MTDRSAQCLVDAKTGERVVVRRNLLTELHLESDDAPLSRGDRVECVDSAPRRLRLRTPAGSDFWIDRFFACLVEVEKRDAGDTGEMTCGRRQ
jgi:hypothetical protein